MTEQVLPGITKIPWPPGVDASATASLKEAGKGFSDSSFFGVGVMLDANVRYAPSTSNIGPHNFDSIDLISTPDEVSSKLRQERIILNYSRLH